MTIAFTFPGQGSQAIGMGKELADAHVEARLVFEEVDEALGAGLSRIMWEGPEDELRLTANAQPALMAVSIAAIRVMQAGGLDLRGRVGFVAGHSLGEYSALCAAGMFSLTDTARLLRIRGDAMQETVPVGEGAMAAIIGLEADAVEAICTEASADGVCQIANDNGGGQLVISGTTAAVEKGAALAGERGAKRTLMLPVSAPFHSALMAPAADVMRAALEGTTLGPLDVPVVANVLAKPVRDPGEEIELLVQQITGQVRWRESVEWMAKNGVTTLYEIGAGRVLTGLARRIDRALTGVAVNTPADVDDALGAILA